MTKSPKKPRNAQKSLDRVGVLTLQLIAAKKENVSLRQQLVNAEERAFGLEVDRDYGNPDERVQLALNGLITRVPRAPAGK